jgi:hypothetical protein
MARERVQVQGLGDAVPGISPTIQRGGQYAVQVQQAGRNKLMDLADALGQVNPMLQQYTRVADIEAEQFEEELAGKSPEEVQAMLKQTEGELDKQVRRGGMGWLTSPLNQKRKLKAIGKLASRDLVSEIEARLINPKQGDPEDLTERANLVRQEFINNTPALQSSLFAQEGLNQVSNTRIQETVANYERQQEAQAKEETLYATGSAMYDKIFNLSQAFEDQAVNGDYNFEIGRDDNGNIITFGDALLEEWNETGAYTPKEQRALLSSVLIRMSADGMELKADGLLLWAQQNLKFGNAKMSDMEYNKLTDLIDKETALAEQRRDKESIEFIADKSGEFKIRITELALNKTTEYNNETFTNKRELGRYFKDEIINNQNLTNEQKKDLLSEIEKIEEGSFRTAETFTKNEILRNAPTATSNGLMRELDRITNAIDIPQDYKNKPEIRTVVQSLFDKLKSEGDNKLESEYIGLGIEGGSKALENYARQRLLEETPKLNSAILEAYDNLIRQEEQVKTGKPLGVEPTEKPEVPEPEEDPEDLIDLLPQWQSLVKDDTTDENSNTAKKYLKQYRPQLANETARLASDSNRYLGIGATTQEEALQLHFRAASKLNGAFSLDVLERLDADGYAVNYAGRRFKPKELIGDTNVDTFVILTQQQLDNAETEEGLEIVKRAKEAAGITIDVYEFIRRQKKVRRDNVIIDYVPMPDLFQPLKIEDEIEALINSRRDDFDPFPDFLLID